mgnify:CR=1 FL=1
MKFRAKLTCVAGMALLQVAVSSATADQPGWGYHVEPVRFAAAEPTPANPAPMPDDPVPSPDDLQPVPSQPIPLTEPQPNDDIVYASASDGNLMEAWCDPCCGRCRGGRARLIGSTCNMPQHQAYFPPMHGYYYFRPYHHSHVPTQQTYARMWGEDPANPYANRIFQTVYEQYRADAAVAQPPIPEQPPVPAQPPMPE